MLFTTYEDDNEMANEFFNIGNDTSASDILSPKQGLTLGNLFASEYDRYKDYKPREIRVSNEKERLMLSIYELSFAINDLNLKLDVDPNNRTYFNLLKDYAKKLDGLVKDYSNKYGALEVCLDLNNNYSWIKNPWPWEGNSNV